METTTDIIKNTAEQTKEVIIPFFYDIVKFAVVLFIIALIFLIIKYLIIKAIKKTKYKKQPKSEEGRKYFLNNDELEAIKLYNKLKDENKKEIKEQMKKLSIK